jgi:hypothetical protein
VPPASVGTGTAPAEGAERGMASPPPVGVVESLAMASVASFVCSDAIFGVPISAKTGHRFNFYELSGQRCMQHFLKDPEVGSLFFGYRVDWCDTKRTTWTQV